MPAPSRPTEVLIVGGGIAGIACALRLAEAGVATTILETRKKLGGRATSFVDIRSGAVLDNCQHVALGCCTNYLDLLRRLGVDDKLTWHRTQYWVERGGRISELRPDAFGDRLPAPVHFGPSFIGAHFLTSEEIARAAFAMGKILLTDRTRWRDATFDRFLFSAGQTDRLIRRFWEPVIVSACNLPCNRVAASSALHVFQEGFLAHKRAAEIGISRVPLLELYDAAEGVLTAAGGSIRLGASVDRIQPGKVTLSSGEELTAPHVVSTVPPERIASTVAPEVIAADPRLNTGAADRLAHSPILGVHLTFQRPVLHIPHAVLVEGATQWLFRKDEHGRAIHAVISAADAWMDLSEQQIADRVMADLRAYFPAANPELLSIRAVKEKRATFAPTPEVEALRPPALPPGAAPTDFLILVTGPPPAGPPPWKAPPAPATSPPPPPWAAPQAPSLPPASPSPRSPACSASPHPHDARHRNRCCPTPAVSAPVLLNSPHDLPPHRPPARRRPCPRRRPPRPGTRPPCFRTRNRPRQAARRPRPRRPG
ncbi:MAG: hydroxysqualene dehydroxylase HpnE [Planctomycetaceae bacterium]|nr:hydroxysqualene dehydroxylase HpnE [Planctomycetaceae bacterium]